ncbi:MAG: flagellar protein FlaG [Magnetococcales bacterium]|nr:flagellar protein FlaG [Magnetococcales bacterium]MBF0321812.1 flagellar protein FlaG [Magnetococcales bacterium]
MSDINNVVAPQIVVRGYADGTMADDTRRSGVDMGSSDRREMSVSSVLDAGRASPDAAIPGGQEQGRVADGKTNVERSWLDAKVEECNKSLVGSTALQFRIDEKTQKLVVRVVDKDTDKVVSQFPSESMLAVSQRMKEMEGVLYDAKV